MKHENFPGADFYLLALFATVEFKMATEWCLFPGTQGREAGGPKSELQEDWIGKHVVLKAPTVRPFGNIQRISESGI